MALETSNGKSTTKVVVLGHYFKFNLGDDLFVDAFQKLFPDFDFTFVDVLTKEEVERADAIFIGGGSFLYAEPQIEAEAYHLLEGKKIFYLSVGSETDIHPQHQDLMRRAKLIAVRNQDGLEKIKEINENTILIPDIVYFLLDAFQSKAKKKKSVLIIPNTTLLPRYDDAYWKHASWTYFKSEFAQFLDHLICYGYEIKLLPFSISPEFNDIWAAVELISHMANRSDSFLISNPPTSATQILELFSEYEAVITQRFHGIILAEMARVPYISIYHHDKLKSSFLNEGKFISYYGLTKQGLIDALDLIRVKSTSVLPIKTDIFKNLKDRVIELIGG